MSHIVNIPSILIKYSKYRLLKTRCVCSKQLLQYLSFIGPPTIAGRVLKIGSVHPSVCPSVFWELCHYFFSKFWHDARNPYKVVCDSQIFQIFFVPRNWGNGLKMGQKQHFLNLLKNLVDNFECWCKFREARSYFNVI